MTRLSGLNCTTVVTTSDFTKALAFTSLEIQACKPFIGLTPGRSLVDLSFTLKIINNIYNKIIK